jgi:capsular polysaccharide export protein
MRAEELPPFVYAYGLSRRKLKILRRFAGNSSVITTLSCAGLPAGSTLVVWGSTPIPEECPRDVNIARLEDGFLRSVGLGADLIKPVSWVFDKTGIYFDATRPSDLEQLLAATTFTPDLVVRAQHLLERIVAGSLTKYNVGSGGWKPPAGVRNVILVPGQVESDASIRFGAMGVTTNMGLLRAVKEANPSTYVVYKSHPDVLAGLRAQGMHEDRALEWCNERVTDIAMGELLRQVDEVHTMTSLTGFEALLRGKRVTCYGRPFYAGWGLTTDMLPVARRNRNLTREELVAGALILYPTYISWITGTLITPEQALEELLGCRGQSGMLLPLWRSMFRLILRRVVGVR